MKKSSSETTLTLPSEKQILRAREQLVIWYQENKRALPWRKNRNPYTIWISEVMLQQTTVAAVMPYFERMIARFPQVENLAEASEAEVFEMWAGLGYYSRARNLHKAAKSLAQSGFPQTADELIKLPGFGPYTSRAVASLAFNEHVGVLDGNVIRVLSRFFGLKIAWWNNKEKQILQKISDALAQTTQNADVNQGLMELGATVCTPKKTLCLLCPWKKNCVALKDDCVTQLPLAKPKDTKEIWLWTFQPEIQNKKIHLVANEQTPFLKKMLFPISTAQRLQKKPQDYAFTHSVTKYSIYIKINKTVHDKGRGISHKKLAQQWYSLDEIKKINPTSLMSKILNYSTKSSKIKK